MCTAYYLCPLILLRRLFLLAARHSASETCPLLSLRSVGCSFIYISVIPASLHLRRISSGHMLDCVSPTCALCSSIIHRRL